jgi:hypothetical protein
MLAEAESDAVFVAGVVVAGSGRRTGTPIMQRRCNSPHAGSPQAAARQPASGHRTCEQRQQGYPASLGHAASVQACQPGRRSSLCCARCWATLGGNIVGNDAVSLPFFSAVPPHWQAGMLPLAPMPIVAVFPQCHAQHSFDTIPNTLQFIAHEHHRHARLLLLSI